MDFCRPLAPSPCALRLTPTLHVLFTSRRAHSAQADPSPPHPRKGTNRAQQLALTWPELECQVSKTRQPRRRRIQAKRQQLFFCSVPPTQPIHPTIPLPYAYALGPWEAISFNQRGRIGVYPYVTIPSEYTIFVFHLFLCLPLSPSAPEYPAVAVGRVCLCPVSTHRHPPASHSAQTKNHSDLNQSQGRDFFRYQAVRHDILLTSTAIAHVSHDGVVEQSVF